MILLPCLFIYLAEKLTKQSNVNRSSKKKSENGKVFD